MDDDMAMMDLRTLRRKRDQAWEMAGLARQDGDREAEKKHTEEAQSYAAEIGERLRGGEL